jgi:hypothetical protein
LQSILEQLRKIKPKKNHLNILYACGNVHTTKTDITSPSQCLNTSKTEIQISVTNEYSAETKQGIKFDKTTAIANTYIQLLPNHQGNHCNEY